MLRLFQIAGCFTYSSGIVINTSTASQLDGYIERTGCIDAYCFICTVYALQHLTDPEEQQVVSVTTGVNVSGQDADTSCYYANGTH